MDGRCETIEEWCSYRVFEFKTIASVPLDSVPMDGVCQWAAKKLLFLTQIFFGCNPNFVVALTGSRNFSISQRLTSIIGS